MAGDLAVLFFEIGESAIARHQTLNLLGACGLRDGAAQLLLLLEGEFEGEFEGKLLGKFEFKGELEGKFGDDYEDNFESEFDGEFKFDGVK
mgnify:CR=1 FL=1